MTDHNQTDRLPAVVVKRQAAQILESTVTDSKIFAWRLKGLSVRAIAHRVGLSPSAVTARMNKILDEVSLETFQNAEKLRDLEVERCNVAAIALYPMVKMGDLKAIQAWHANIELRARLLQLFRPKTVVNVNIDYDALTDEQLEKLAAGEPL